MDPEQRLAAWFGTQLPDTGQVRVEGLDRVEFGHSAETLVLTLLWTAGDGEHRKDVVIRVRPPAPGLLEPYDLKLQFDILRTLGPTPVRAPQALWYEGSGQVLGREFYVMERLPGTVYERGFPKELASQPDTVRRMSESILEQVVAIHTLDLHATGLDRLDRAGDGHDYLDRQLDHWEDQIRRHRTAPLPALERLVHELRGRRPAPCPTVTLVHGDPKPGNFAFVGTEVSAVFDWEMAAIGDPLADIGWIETLWNSPGYPTSAPGALTVDEVVARWEQLTGIEARHRNWYRALQRLKMAVILFVGGRLFVTSRPDDIRLYEMTHAVAPVTRLALADLGITDPVETGPVVPDLPAVQARPSSLDDVRES